MPSFTNKDPSLRAARKALTSPMALPHNARNLSEVLLKGSMSTAVCTIFPCALDGFPRRTVCR